MFDMLNHIIKPVKIAIGWNPLKQKIKELEEKIVSSTEEKSVIEAELNKLRLAEFEEDMATESNQQLLKG